MLENDDMLVFRLSPGGVDRRRREGGRREEDIHIKVRRGDKKGEK